MEECHLDEFNVKVCPDSAVSVFYFSCYYKYLVEQLLLNISMTDV